MKFKKTNHHGTGGVNNPVKDCLVCILSKLTIIAQVVCTVQFKTVSGGLKACYPLLHRYRGVHSPVKDCLDFKQIHDCCSIGGERISVPKIDLSGFHANDDCYRVGCVDVDKLIVWISRANLDSTILWHVATLQRVFNRCSLWPNGTCSDNVMMNCERCAYFVLCDITDAS